MKTTMPLLRPAVIAPEPARARSPVAVFVPPRKNSPEANESHKTSASKNRDVKPNDTLSTGENTVSDLWRFDGDQGQGQQEQQDQKGEQKDQQEAADAVTKAASDNAVNSDMDTEALLSLLEPVCHESNIFELLLPEGNNLRVAVDNAAGHVRLMLWPTPASFAKKIINKKMELQEGLQRRMGGHLTFTLFEP